MGYLLTYFVIITYATTLTIISKKKIEEVMPIGIVAIILVIFLSGLLDNLQIGIIVVEALTVVQVIFILIMIIKNSKEVALRILTPGLAVYSILYILNILINQNRVLENYDEFNHWAVEVKNMYLFNSYTNKHNIVQFNEYPPFTANFQYFFVMFQKAYSEDALIIAQNVLYFSIVIPITKCIKWDKSLLKLLVILPLIVFLPIIFYENFYLEILVDGIIGVMFAYVMLSAFESEEQTKFKYLKILAGEIMLVLTKASSIPLAILALVIMLIEKLTIGLKQNKQSAKKEIKAIGIILFIIIIITSIWYAKVQNTEKAWNFKKMVEIDSLDNKYVFSVMMNLLQMSFWGEEITTKGLTVFSIVILFIGMYICYFKKDKKDNYYQIAMLISIFIWLIGLSITYATIFDGSQASRLVCFSRYVSTILLATAMFWTFLIVKEEKSFKKHIIIISILILLLPMTNIKEKYFNKNYITQSQTARDNRTKIRNYKDKLKATDKIAYIVSSKNANYPYLTLINNYEIMPLKISKIMKGTFEDANYFKNKIKECTHIFIYDMTEKEKEKIKEAFEQNVVENNVLYKIEKENGQMILKSVH